MINEEVIVAVNDVIKLGVEEMNEQSNLSLSTSDSKLKYIITNNLIGINQVISDILNNYINIISHPEVSINDMMGMKKFILEYRHIRINILENFK